MATEYQTSQHNRTHLN